MLAINWFQPPRRCRKKDIVTLYDTHRRTFLDGKSNFFTLLNKTPNPKLQNPKTTPKAK